MNTIGIKKQIVEIGIDRPNEVIDVVADIKKIESELNWHPQITFRKGIEECAKFYKNMKLF